MERCSVSSTQAKRTDVLIFLLVLGLARVAACELPQDGPHDAAAVIPLVQCENKLYVPARINGVDVGLMVLDTGSSHTTVRPAVAEKFTLPLIGRKNVDRTDGRKLEELVVAKELQIGPAGERRDGVQQALHGRQVQRVDAAVAVGVADQAPQGLTPQSSHLPTDPRGLSVSGAVAGDRVQGQIDSVPPEPGVNPSHRLAFPKVIAE